MPPRKTPPFHSYPRTSDVALLCQNLFGIPDIREPSSFALQEDNGRTTAKFESVWTLPFGRTTVAMNESKRLAHQMAVSPIAFRHNLRLSPAPAHAQAREVRPDLLVLSP